ncbi:AAA family ATPase [Rhodoferax saidenbachensis]|uniref:ABC-type cobalamin/Fe3+-siderophores transport system ATPase subunit n=1 Tax=Rhodoferax saidenbachensis TaxID=1484693 RepID=A0ABU1ZID5_9BURK|nr:AAA family ATPase [Rhodoferax saidenbachensis]MDR7305294.1 ABC-type cobalamin/Fe3+-siderophores transport system ATPase subunit [Rhodoferax saidenbachensis]
MHIKTLQIQNYKSFWQSEEIPFEQGFNLIVGQNDAGKSALLECLLPGIENKPHRSMLTAPEGHIQDVPESTATKRIQLTSGDLKAYLSSSRDLGVPGNGNESDSVKQRFTERVESGGEFKGTWIQRNFQDGNFEPPFAGGSPLRFKNTKWPSGIELGEHHVTGGGNCLQDIGWRIGEDIYGFKAERYRVGASTANGNRVLLPDASNLPEVLNKLAEDPATEKELLNNVRTIFPHIKHISAALEGNNTAHIRIWTHDISTRRRDLAIPLADSGSGIGQVLAMLYVVVTADRPKVILIDEPQSFLHPGAVRKLFEILRTHSQHQYILTTHAPMGLAMTGSENMLLVRRGEEQSTVTRLDPATQEGVSIFLSEVGARLSDVYGADNVLWVEGKTEERCFPIILRDVAHQKIRGTQILGVVNTGDLETEHADRVVEIYQRLSNSASVLPPALAFVFDSEGRSQKEMDDISRRANGLLKWLPRRMYENYLIDCQAVCAVINEEDTTRMAPLLEETVKSWLTDHGANSKFFPKTGASSNFGTEEWNRDVHGGKILQDLFGEFTEQRVRYDKVRHGEKLTTLLSTRPTPSINELAVFLSSFFRE